MFDFYLSYTYQNQHLLNNYDAFERKLSFGGFVHQNYKFKLITD